MHTGELRKRGIRLRLHDQPFQVLAMLLARPGVLVTREELQKSLWPSGTFVDFENGLNSAVNRLRDALGDSAENPKFIETVTRHGYRLIVPVECANGHVPPVEGQMTGLALPINQRWNRKLVLVAGVLAAVALIPTAAWRLSENPPSIRTSLKFSPVPLVTYGDGEQWLPAFSPDGSRVAYSWSTAGGWYLEVKQLGSETRLRLTKQAAKFPPGPAWSPDGRQIAYARADALDDRGIFITSAMGGTERRLRSLSPWRVPQRLLSWSPDGRWIVFADEAETTAQTKSKERGPNALYLISPDTLETRQLTAPVGNDFGDSAPAFSPDGSTIAFVHTTADSQDEICTIPAQGGAPRKLAVRGIWTNGLTWNADGKSLVFDRSIAGGFSLWTVSLAGGEAHPLDIPADRVSLLEPTLWRDRLAYESHQSMNSIGRIPLDGTRLDVPQTRFASTRQDRMGRISPRGDRIAFVSDRTGTDELWIADADGTNASQLTHLSTPLNDVAWSPEGKSLAVSATSGKVVLVEIESTGSRIIFQGSAFTDETASSIAFSSDGRFLYVLSEPGTGLQYSLLKVPIAGGDSIGIMDGLITAFAESPDGQTLFYSRAESASRRDTLAIWKRPVQGGAEQLVTPTSGIWGVSSQGLYLVTNHSTLDLYSFSGKGIRTIARLGEFGVSPPLSISPDGRWALLGYERHHSVEIDMVRDFN